MNDEEEMRRIAAGLAHALLALLHKRNRLTVLDAARQLTRYERELGAGSELIPEWERGHYV